MKVQNVLLTGAGGKIGRAVLPELVKAGYSVRALEHTDGLQVERLNNVDVVVGDLRDASLAARLIEDMDVVIHLANVKENKALFLDANIKGTFYLIDACKESGHIKQYIQAGSDARAGIYYFPQPVPIDENHPHSAYPTYYALSKVLEEVMCEQFRIMYQVPITVLRFSWVHAEDDILTHLTLKGPDFGVPIWRNWAVSPEQKAYFENGQDAVACLIHPDGSAGKRQIVGIKDVVQSVMLSVGNRTAIGEAFNVSGPSPFSYDVLADYVAGKLGLPVVKFEVAEAHDFCIDMTKSRSVLGLDPEYDVFRIVDEALEFRRAGRKRSPCLYPG
ncbi:MAG TPA: NAD(P)-dependent oxidoreductase [Candidatus Hydrogenedentes bacterium]|nr:NAD(P)-dependent oxidoreductase [Candidatus Hydrogenedentota bacterium]